MMKMLEGGREGGRERKRAKREINRQKQRERGLILVQLSFIQALFLLPLSMTALLFCCWRSSCARNVLNLLLFLSGWNMIINIFGPNIKRSIANALSITKKEMAAF